MAKRKSNKSESIRQYMAKHPEVSAGDIAKALKVQPALVYNVKASLKAKRGRKKTTNNKAQRSISTSGSDGAAGHVVEAAKFIQSCGGAESARQALKLAEQVAAVLGD